MDQSDGNEENPKASRQKEAPIRPSMAGASGMATETLEQASIGIKRGVHEFKRLGDVQVLQRAGNMAEAYHNASFNIDAAGQGSGIRSQITFDLPGMKRSPKDLLINTGTRSFSCQLKQTTSESMSKIAKKAGDPKYAGVDSIVLPSDKLASVRAYAKGRLGKPSKSKNPMVTEQGHRQILEKATDRVSVGGASSKPITSQDAVNMAKDVSVMERELNNQALKKVGIQAGWASVAGAVAAGLASDEESLGGKAKDALKGAALAGGGMLATTFAVKGLKVLAETKGFALLKPLGKGNVAANVVDFGATLCHRGYKVAKGDATFVDMADACAEKGAGMAGSTGGMMLAGAAAAVFTAPGVVLVGATIALSVGGGYVGPKLYRAGKKLFVKMFGKGGAPMLPA